VPSERLLSYVLREFAHTLVTDFPIQAILDHLVERIVTILPITGAGVTVISPDTAPHYVAASDESALRFEALQSELGEGPCMAAYQTGRSVSVPDLRSETRFPTFVAGALETGLAAVFTFPLRSGAEQLGALDLYRTTPGQLDADAMDAAQVLADVAAAYLINAQARTDLRESADRSREQALHDPLTGLPNRILLFERLNHAVLRNRRSRKIAAVLFVDLDRFKVINDVYGHSVGDELLVAVAERLRKVLRPDDTLARLSGDEFVVLSEDLDASNELDVRGQVDAIAARIGAAIAAPFVLSDAAIELTASVGIAFSRPGARTAEQLLEAADAAMYQAKRNGGARHQIVDLREQSLTDDRAGLEHDLRGAVARGELRTEYQPIVETHTGRVAGVEALLRWAHPTRGMVSPAELIPIAEQAGLITEIGRWVLEQTCRDRHRWQHSRRPDDLTISINVSAHQLMSPDYTATVATVLTDTDTEPGRVILEVTESVFAEDAERALFVLDELKHLGVRLALDDFGTGYCSLNYLKRFPIDIVKVDQSFVADMKHDRASRAIVSAVIDLAHTLDMTVVAEGVETAEQHRDLEALGCDSCQGYYFARPQPADNIDTLIEEQVGGTTRHLPALVTTAADGR
jgi:diguanylate cyclase (GGDEF)-like protein